MTQSTNCHLRTAIHWHIFAYICNGKNAALWDLVILGIAGWVLQMGKGRGGSPLPGAQYVRNITVR